MLQQALEAPRPENAALLSNIPWLVVLPFCGGACSAKHAEHAKIRL